MNRPGRPDDLDGAIVFLASEASRYITGQTLLVDGGITVGRTRAVREVSQAGRTHERRRYERDVPASASRTSITSMRPSIVTYATIPTMMYTVGITKAHI